MWKRINVSFHDGKSIVVTSAFIQTEEDNRTVIIKVVNSRTIKTKIV